MATSTEYNEIRLIDVKELSRLLAVSPRTIWRMQSHGKLLPPIRVGGSVRWRAKDVVQWIEAGCPPCS